MFKRLVIGMAIVAILSFFGVAYMAVADVIALYAARSEEVVVKEVQKPVKKMRKGRHHETV